MPSPCWNGPSDPGTAEWDPVSWAFVTTTEWNGSLADPTLHVDRFGLSIGGVSVGLPSSCTTDTVLSRYVDLVRLVQPDGPRPVEATADDLSALAEATGLTPASVEQRLRALQR